MSEDTRIKAAGIFNQLNRPVKSDVDGELFNKFTHRAWTHEKLVSWWTSTDAQKRGVTTCMEFVNWYSDELRYAVGKAKKPILGSFYPETLLADIGMSHAWVPAGNGAHPYRGDILRHSKWHIDICADCDGSTITRVASGQGTVPNYDLLKRCDTEVFIPGNYQGWIDIETFYETEPQSKKTAPSWLVNRYWEMTWRSQDFYYWFDGNGKVVWCDWAHITWGAKPAASGGAGRYTYTVDDFDTKIVIYWDSGSIEHYSRDYQASELTLRGDWNWSENISGWSKVGW